ncbi:fatty acid synthase alpha subunit Lsd1, partial [Coemansia biformis]
VVDEYPKAATQLLASEDVQFFVALGKRRGQKPFPFISVLDADFGAQLQKDAIWQSEDLGTVVDGDPQRVGIQQGPVSAQYAVVIDEPVKSILDGIYHSHIESLTDILHCGDKSSIPVIEYIGAEPAAVSLPATVQEQISESRRVYWMPLREDQLPELDTWLLALAGPRKSWLHALVTTPHFAQGDRIVDNYARRVLRPRSGRKVTVHIENGLPSSVEIANAAGVLELEASCSADRTIRLTIHHTTVHSVVVPLPLVLAYEPSHVHAPIHRGIHTDNNPETDFAISVWTVSADEPTTYVDIADANEAVRDEFTITSGHSRAFCDAVGNRAWQYAVSRDGRMLAPMEFMQISAMRCLQRVINSTIFGSGQSNVIHIDNRLEFEDGVDALCVGDTISVTARIDCMVNVKSGKRLMLTASFGRAGQKIGAMKSTFLSRFHYLDAPRTFQYHRNQKIAISLASVAEVAVLEAKEWFFYLGDTRVTIELGMDIEFCLDSEYRFAKEGVYSSIVTTGTVSVKARGSRRVHIADVDYRWGRAAKNPVVEYLNRHRVADDGHLFDDGGYSLTTAANAKLAMATAPASNWNYAKYSLDCNPIHTNPYIADYSGLPEMIAHGLRTAASTRAIVETIAAKGRVERTRAYEVAFIDMVLPRDRLSTELFHVGMKRGRMLVKGRTSKEGGGPVMDVTAEVDQPKTAYVFTGQGSQEPGIGMALYEQSAEARGIWDRANKHMLDTYDIDLLDIVRTNPKELTIYFHGKAGERVQGNYMALSKRVPDDSYMDGFKQTPLIPGITAQSCSHTFLSSTGLLDATQFTQVALTVSAMAAVADMRAKGLVQSDAMFAGHSLGEHCALAAMADIFAVEDVVDITFYRGLLMQSAVPRDEQGRSEFGMAAVDPSRVAKGFGEDQLHLVVDAINAASPGLLEIVNYNVRGHQYVAAGTLTNLAVLRLVLDAIAATGVPTAEAVSTVLTGPIGTEAVRSKATIPLHGIDAPFHSQLFAGHVPDLREALRTKLHDGTVSPDMLGRRYIPNLTAVPFEVTRAYFETVYMLT